MLDNLLEEIEDDKTQELQFSDNKRQSQPIRTMKSEKKKQRQFQYTSMNVPSNKAPLLFKPLSKTRKYSKSKRY